jgi:hypothetical protein
MKTISNIGRNGTNAVASQRFLTAVAFNVEDYETYEPALAGVDVFVLIPPARLEQIEWEYGVTHYRKRLSEAFAADLQGPSAISSHSMQFSPDCCCRKAAQRTDGDLRIVVFCCSINACLP